MLYIMVFILLFIFLKNNGSYQKRKGNIGEKIVYSKLKSLGSEYKVFNNVLIQKDDGTTSQIDHVVVSKYGIFVIETKNFSGYIYGKEDDYKWTQVLNKNSKYQFYNPIKQNLGHVKALRNVLGEQYYIPIVVFTTKSNIHNVSANSIVIQTDELVSVIRRFKEVKIEKPYVFAFAIEEYNKQNYINEGKHIKQVKRNIKR